MSLRKKNKDHIRESAFGPQAVAAEVTDYTSTPLQFWTKHEHKPVFIDLSVFETGEISRKVRGGQWGGPFSGRPELIHQLAPAIKEHLQFSPKSSATSFVKHLRQWWRLFDEIESRTKEVGLPLIRISSVKDFTELHRQAAMDAGISPQSFHALRRVGGFKPEVQHLQPSKVRRCHHLVRPRPINNFSLKSASPLPV